MELESDFTKFFGEFQEEIAKLQANLNFLNDLRKTIDSASDWLKNDKNKWALTFQAVQQLRDIMRRFNDDADTIFDEFNKNENPDNGHSIDMQQRLDGGKCQITEIVDSKNCICYAIDLNGKTVSRLRTFWKEASFLRLQPLDGEDSTLNDTFGVEFKSKLNRAKFMFDSTMNAVRISLIDTGEIIEHGQFNLQKLPHDIKSLPAAAFRCKVNRIGNAAAQLLPDSLKGQIFDYQIRSNVEINDMFCIDIRPTNPFLMENAINEVTQEHDAHLFNIADDSRDPFASNDFVFNDDENVNMEQTMDETFQRKWNNAGKSSEKILNTDFVCSPNHDFSDRTINGFQADKNRNKTASLGGQINQGFASDSDNDWGNGNGAASCASSIAVDQQPMIQSAEKSIPIKHGCDGATASNVSSTRYHRQMGNRAGMYSKNNNSNNKKSAAGGQPWTYDRQRQNSNALFERIRSMKTQRETTVLQSNHTKLDKTPRIGEQITIIPTHVVNAKEFYGQLGAHFNALQYSQQRLNYRRLYAQNEPYSQLPDEGVLVLVLLENGTFYRARVLNASSQHEILVFLLDYGTTYKVDLRFIYKWTQVCNEFPFYSIVFSLGNVQHNENASEAGASEPMDATVFEFIKSKIPKTFTSAEVIGVDEHSITVRIFDDNGFDIGEEISCMISKNTGTRC